MQRMLPPEPALGYNSIVAQERRQIICIAEIARLWSRSHLQQSKQLIQHFDLWSGPIKNSPGEVRRIDRWIMSRRPIDSFELPLDVCTVPLDSMTVRGEKPRL